MNLQGTFAERGLKALRRMVVDHQLPLMFERSLRLQPNTVEDRRALFSLPTAALEALGANGLSEVLQICRVMSSPDSHRNSIQQFFPAAEFIHFGFECSGDNLIGKCYLELSPSASLRESLDSRLTFIGFKWSMLDSSLAVISRYRNLNATRWNDIQRAMLSNFPQTPLADASGELLECFGPNAANLNSDASDLRLLQVTEEGSDRLSHDLNVYVRERSIEDVANLLVDISHQQQGNSHKLAEWIQQNSTATVGHLSMGLNRYQIPFVTLYHSADVNQLSLP
ncbi:MAG: hypothetical protein P8J37_16775 [Fuerstiella sp.]|nr:hypothetical protein [Fuerstiella sp.]